MSVQSGPRIRDSDSLDLTMWKQYRASPSMASTETMRSAGPPQRDFPQERSRERTRRLSRLGCALNRPLPTTVSTPYHRVIRWHPINSQSSLPSLPEAELTHSCRMRVMRILTPLFVFTPTPHRQPPLAKFTAHLESSTCSLRRSNRLYTVKLYYSYYNIHPVPFIL